MRRGLSAQEARTGHNEVLGHAPRDGRSSLNPNNVVSAGAYGKIQFTPNVQAPALMGGQDRQGLLLWVYLFSALINGTVSVATTLLAGMTYHRNKLNRVLTQLQIENARMENERLRSEIERLKLESTQTGVILVSGN